VKAHFRDVDEPNLKEGSDLAANCGKLIKNAQFAMMVDFSGEEVKVMEAVMGLNPLKVCVLCIHLSLRSGYVYALIPGEETRHLEEL
jgi:hypothetical protein